MIEIRGLSKKYGKKKVVADVSVTIQKGQITSFIGPNGAGKSTLLSMVSRLLDSDSGEVIIDQHDSKKIKSNDMAKRVAILKQSNFLNVRLTIKELVSFGRFPYSKGRLTEEDEKVVQQSIEYMNLKELQDQYLEELSGGQKQRAFIAMVIAQDTDYILLDEPLNNLDMKHSVQIMKILRKLVDELVLGWYEIRKVLATFKPEHLRADVVLGGDRRINATEFLERMAGHTSTHAGQLVPAFHSDQIGGNWPTW